MGTSEILGTIDHAASVATIIGFPTVVIGLIQLYRERGRSMRDWKKWIALVLLGVGSIAYAIDFSDRMGWLSSDAKTGSTLALLNAFERHAAEEGFIATTLKFKVPYVHFDQTKNVKYPYMGDKVSVEERTDWRAYLLNLDQECAKAGLIEARKRIAEAITEFDRQGNDLTRISAWRYYHSVSERLKEEIDSRFGAAKKSDP